MYETAIPEETQQRISEMGAAGLVVGIPSYRNSRTIGEVAGRVMRGLDRYYGHLHPVIVHADGHSFDETLSVAGHLPLPASVRRVTTRYQGLPGKGSALRAVFEIAARLRAKAVLVIEADVVSFQEEWVPALVEPVLANQAEMVMPLYEAIRPAMPSTDLLCYPLLMGMFNIPVRQPTAGEFAVSGGVATFFAERDVWETDVARDGVDVWMVAEVALEEGRIAQVQLGPKLHRSNDSITLTEAKFLQEVGTVFRMAHLHEQAWTARRSTRSTVTTLGSSIPFVVREREGLPDASALWRSGKRAVKSRLPKQWQEILAPEQYAQLEPLVSEADDAPQFADHLWARIVYDFLVVYNLGEGDPDKVVTALFPLFLMRSAALIAETERLDAVAEAYEALVIRQLAAFLEERNYLEQRWQSYVSPEQMEMWRDLGILPD